MNDEKMNQYLWDKSGAPDPDIQALESALSQFRHAPQPLKLEHDGSRADREQGFCPATGSSKKLGALAPRLLRPKFAFAFATAAAIFLIGLLAIRARFEWRPDDPWKVTRVAGQPRIATSVVGDAAHLAVGEALETDATSRARLKIGNIGTVDIEPNSRVRLLATRTRHHRIALDYGTIQAHTWAPPFSFGIETPSSTLFDIGCAFTLHMNRDGFGIVHVDAGWVQFEYGDAQSLVPADAEAVTRPGRGPGTPYFADAPADFKAALNAFDTSEESTDARTRALEAILAAARPRDAISLLNLLHKVPRPRRDRVLDLLSRFVPLPKGVTREQVLALELDAMNRYWTAVDPDNPKGWIMRWKDVLGN
jgi:hypothetical protein